MSVGWSKVTAPMNGMERLQSAYDVDDDVDNDKNGSMMIAITSKRFQNTCSNADKVLDKLVM